MKTYIVIILSIYSSCALAQKTLDTIYANENKNVALFFPEPIRQGITGSQHFVFTYNREKEQYFGLLQAQPGMESNLLAITSKGSIYSYILKYSDKLPKLNYFINQSESIGSEFLNKRQQKPEIQAIDKKIKRINYFQKFSEYLLGSKSDKLAIERKKGIKLKLHKMVYKASEVYLVMEIENYSGIDFEIDYLNIYRVNGNRKRKASYQKLQQEAVYRYKMPNFVSDKKKQRFVYVLPKFVLGEDEKLLIELKELNGSRKVIMID
ncbi:uncharacterized protein DUF4138 [Jejuia pallidilutea]|uniref:Uncharacterized protein DUF4138 n=1 Tax=Jejuia pallidilutea TaxID=504487 RepID=A0A362X6S1_9FLAO|nr:DUF4138 domain-containing protein [Jejuia pallidilutea]PQV48832.1 uncharacterized protein DUF4138 [Jejuia pallidilutea]